MKNRMMQRWVDLTRESGASLSMCLRVFEEIERYYNGRPYHSLYGHICQLLDWQEEYFPDAPLDVILAIWFHDLFNIPGFTRNEEVSAKLMKFLVSSRGPAHQDLFATEIVENAAKHIMATRDHVAHCSEAAILCDLDLFSLAGSHEEYDAITARVHDEYSDYPEEWWVAGRMDFIKKYLARPFIFQTERMQEWYEHVARANLQREYGLYGNQTTKSAGKE